MSGRPRINQNEYFVPADGIDREVIQADICRYLGNDATVRPATIMGENGHPILGYDIRAYRNLTVAMVEDLKEDSKKWQEAKMNGATYSYIDPVVRSDQRRYAAQAVHQQPPLDYPDIKLPRYDRTITDVYADELYNPDFAIGVGASTLPHTNAAATSYSSNRPATGSNAPGLEPYDREFYSTNPGNGFTDPSRPYPRSAEPRHNVGSSAGRPQGPAAPDGMTYDSGHLPPLHGWYGAKVEERASTGGSVQNRGRQGNPAPRAGQEASQEGYSYYYPDDLSANRRTGYQSAPQPTTTTSHGRQPSTHHWQALPSHRSDAEIPPPPLPPPRYVPIMIPLSSKHPDPLPGPDSPSMSDAAPTPRYNTPAPEVDSIGAADEGYASANLWPRPSATPPLRSAARSPERSVDAHELLADELEKLRHAWQEGERQKQTPQGDKPNPTLGSDAMVAGQSHLDPTALESLKQHAYQSGQQDGRRDECQAVSVNGQSLSDGRESGLTHEILEHRAAALIARARPDLPTAEDEDEDRGGQPPATLTDRSYSDHLSRFVSDSGYASMAHGAALKESASHTDPDAMDVDKDETATIYDDEGSLADKDVSQYISELADNIFRKIPTDKLDEVTVRRIVDSLPQLLRVFALRIGLSQDSRERQKMSRDVMFFVHKHRHLVANALAENYVHLVDASDEAPNRDPVDKAAVQARIRAWLEGVGSLPAPNGPPVRPTQEDEGGDDWEDEGEPMDVPVGDYRQLIFRSSAYQMLLRDLLRDSTLHYDEDFDCMAYIRTQILDAVPGSTANRVSRYHTPTSHVVRLMLDWSPEDFCTAQRWNLKSNLLRAVTITGSATNALAQTPEQYLGTVWPSLGPTVLRAMRMLSEVKAPTFAKLPDGTVLDLDHRAGSEQIHAIVTGLIDTVIAVAQQLSWLAAALRFPVDAKIALCRPVFKRIESTTPTLSVSFESDDADASSFGRKVPWTTEVCPGHCWFGLFRQATIVRGYPIPHTPTGMGLELPLSLAAELVAARGITEFGGKLFLKGFSAMLIPTKHTEEVVAWHLLHTRDGSRISYLDSTLDHIDISLQELEKKRHVVGWCTAVKCNVGKVSANYTITRSMLPPTRPGALLEDGVISTSTFRISDNAPHYSLGLRERPSHISREGYQKSLRWISAKYFVFWDEDTKRGWLLSGTAALLHLVLGSIHHNQMDRFKGEFKFEVEHFESFCSSEEGEEDGDAVDVLMDKGNRRMKLFKNDDEEDKGKGAEVEKESEVGRWFTFQDRVEELFSVLERMSDFQTGAQIRRKRHDRPGWPRSHLEGWDFADVAVANDPVYPRVATLPAQGRAWVDFVRGLSAVTLFGRGFGELLGPIAKGNGSFAARRRPGGALPAWDAVPCRRYLLACAVRDLDEISKKHGGVMGKHVLLSDEVVWDAGRVEAFQVRGRTGGRTNPDAQPQPPAEPVQVLFPRDAEGLSPAGKRGRGFRSPLRFARGAVVFGQNKDVHWQWGDEGDPVEGDPPPMEQTQDGEDEDVSEEEDGLSPFSGSSTAFHDSGLGSSLGSASKAGSGTGSASGPRSDGSDEPKFWSR